MCFHVWWQLQLQFCVQDLWKCVGKQVSSPLSLLCEEGGDSQAMNRSLAQEEAFGEHFEVTSVILPTAVLNVESDL